MEHESFLFQTRLLRLYMKSDNLSAFYFNNWISTYSDYNVLKNTLDFILLNQTVLLLFRFV